MVHKENKIEFQQSFRKQKNLEDFFAISFLRLQVIYGTNYQIVLSTAEQAEFTDYVYETKRINSTEVTKRLGISSSKFLRRCRE